MLVAGDSLETDKDVLLNLKSFLQENNLVTRGRYSEWSERSSNNPCNWWGIMCSPINGTTARVIGINLSDSHISGEIFKNFSMLTKLSYLDLSRNTLGGMITEDLSRCQKLGHLNLSNNIFQGELNLTGLNKLEKLDLSVNRFSGEVRLIIPVLCDNLIVMNISSNNFTGSVNGSFDAC